MREILLIFVIIMLAIQLTHSYIPAFQKSMSLLAKNQPIESKTSLDACRRNNKLEKRRRNRDYARRFQSKTGGSRRKVVVEEKRLVVAASEEKFQSQVFKMTTDEDMPAYSGFDFSS